MGFKLGCCMRCQEIILRKYCEPCVFPVSLRAIVPEVRHALCVHMFQIQVCSVYCGAFIILLRMFMDSECREFYLCEGNNLTIFLTISLLVYVSKGSWLAIAHTHSFTVIMYSFNAGPCSFLPVTISQCLCQILLF